MSEYKVLPVLRCSSCGEDRPFRMESEQSESGISFSRVCDACATVTP